MFVCHNLGQYGPYDDGPSDVAPGLSMSEERDWEFHSAAVHVHYNPDDLEETIDYLWEQYMGQGMDIRGRLMRALELVKADPEYR